MERGLFVCYLAVGGSVKVCVVVETRMCKNAIRIFSVDRKVHNSIPALFDELWSIRGLYHMGV